MTLNWDWSKLAGSLAELKWNRKDLCSLEQVIKLVPERSAVIQAGGCLGVFAKYLANEFETVYTFEPDPHNFAKLVHNVPELNVIKLQAALGCSRGLVRTECSLRGNDGKTVLHEGMTRVEYGGGTIPTLMIDDLDLSRCDLIYLDVEGYEFYALRGAIRTIERCRPVIVCEVNRGIQYFGLEPDDLRVWLRMRRYEPVAKFRSDEVFRPMKV